MTPWNLTFFQDLILMLMILQRSLQLSAFKYLFANFGTCLMYAHAHCLPYTSYATGRYALVDEACTWQAHWSLITWDFLVVSLTAQLNSRFEFRTYLLDACEEKYFYLFIVRHGNRRIIMKWIYMRLDGMEWVITSRGKRKNRENDLVHRETAKETFLREGNRYVTILYIIS